MSIKSYYTAKELSGLPCLPETVRGVISKADRESWSFRKRAGRGGGREYSVTSLPAETREYITRKSITTPAIQEPAQVPAISKTATIIVPAHLKQWQRDIMDARVAIMRLIERAAPMVGVNKAILTIVEASVNGQLEEYAAANARKGASRALSYDGIMKWWRIWKKADGNCMTLAPKDTENYLEPAWAPALMACWAKPQKPNLTDVLEELKTAVPKAQMPTYGQARHYLKKLGIIERESGRKTGNELKSLKPFRRRDTSEMYPGDAYTADGHCFDGEVAHPYHGRPFRPEITPVIDVATRKIVGWSCDLAESGLAVLDALRTACENYGPCSIFYTDNGSGYKNQMMTAPGTGILHRLGITPEYSRPRNPQAHGISERTHQTVLIKAAQQLCTYIGHHMDGDVKQIVFKKTRKAIKETGSSDILIEWDDFVAFINAAIEKYNNTPHRGLPATRDSVTRNKINLTPNQAWELGLQRMQRELPEEQWLQPATELPDLYHPAIERTVNRGEIQFGTLSTGLPKRYYSPDLANWHGHRVQVAFSPSDASRVWVRDLEHGRLLAVAKLGGNSDHYFAPSYLEEKRIKRGEQRLKRLENHAEEIRLEMYGPAPVPVEHDQQTKAKVLQIARQIEEAQVTETELFTPPDGDQACLRIWQEFDERRSAGESLSESEEAWWLSWQNNKTCRAWLALRGEQ